MLFVNEYIPKEEKEQYAEIEKCIISKVGPTGHAPASQWTIDRERNMFLSQIKSGREDWARLSWYLFSRMGQWFVIEIYLVDTVGGYGDPRTTTYRIEFIATFEKGEQHIKLSNSLEKEKLLKDLHEAFTARRGDGVYAPDEEYSMIFQFGKRM